jgi:hypothetical protein
VIDRGYCENGAHFLSPFKPNASWGRSFFSSLILSPISFCVLSSCFYPSFSIIIYFSFFYFSISTSSFCSYLIFFFFRSFCVFHVPTPTILRSMFEMVSCVERLVLLTHVQYPYTGISRFIALRRYCVLYKLKVSSIGIYSWWRCCERCWNYNKGFRILYKLSW